MAKKKYGVVDIELEDEQKWLETEADIAEQNPTPKSVQVLDVSNSDYINTGLDGVKELNKYNLKSITIYKGRNTVIEIIRQEV